MSKTILYKGDCLIESDRIDNGSVDLILTDLPYGTINGIGASTKGGTQGRKSSWSNVNTSWDIAIDPTKIHNIANRILRRNGKMILFAQQPFTTTMINAAIPNLQHNYNCIWLKDHFANALCAKKACVNYYEDILIFTKRHPICSSEFTHPLRGYFKNVLGFIGKKRVK